MTRIIIHADLDAFFASVEQLDRPELRGKPVIVGGSAESRGVVAAASYEARRFGVRSAMPTSRALRLCPNAVLAPPRFDRYIEVSRQVMAIFRAVTPLVEPLSLDEAFLDVTERAADFGEAEALARRLKASVRATTGLTVSIGVGTNKTVAKIASDKEKPGGLVVVAPGGERRFLDPLPVRSLWGVGPKADAALAAAGIRTVGQLAEAGERRIERLFGSRGAELQRMARGVDDRPVQTARERKSVGAETTFPRDLPDGPELRAQLDRIARRVAERLAANGTMARTVTLKLRYDDFRTITRQTSRATPSGDADAIAATAAALLTKVAGPDDRFRLIGVQCGNLTGEDEGPAQLSIWGPDR